MFHCERFILLQSHYLLPALTIQRSPSLVDHIKANCPRTTKMLQTVNTSLLAYLKYYFCLQHNKTMKQKNLRLVYVWMENLVDKTLEKSKRKIYQSQVLSGLTTENTKLNNFNSHFGTWQLYFKHGHHH